MIPWTGPVARDIDLPSGISYNSAASVRAVVVTGNFDIVFTPVLS